MFHNFSLVRAAKTLALPLILSAGLAAAPAQAAYYASYTITSPYNIDSLVLTGHGASSEDGSYFVSSSPGGFQTYPGVTTVQNPFPDNYSTLYAALFGVTDLIPGSIDTFSALVEPVDHLVLAVNNGYAASLISGGQDFSELFPDFDETALIGALNTVSNRDGVSQEDIDAAGNLIFSFSDYIYGAGGNFNVSLSEGFSLVAFSTGSDAGSGLSTTIAIPTNPAVPEPASWAMMIGGFGLIGTAMRRRRAAPSILAA